MPLIEMRFPEPGTLLTPVFPAPTNARTFVILRLLGVLAGVVAKAVDGRMPADQETIRYTGVYGDGPRRPAVPDARGARRRLRRALLRRRRGHHPRRPRLAEPADRVHRGPVPVPRRVVSGWPSTPAAPASSAAASATRSTSGCSRDAHFMSIADRSILACWGVKGGRAGQPFQVTIDPGGPARARGRRARRRRAGAGRRGDPDPDDRRRWLGRPAAPRPGAGGARRRVAQGVAGGCARGDYGVVLTGPSTATTSASTRRPRSPSAAGDRRLEQARPPGCSSTAVPATRACPAVPRTRRSTCVADAVLRAATLDDVPAIGRIWHAAWHDAPRRSRARQRSSRCGHRRRSTSARSPSCRTAWSPSATVRWSGSRPPAATRWRSSSWPGGPGHRGGPVVAARGRAGGTTRGARHCLPWSRDRQCPRTPLLRAGGLARRG